MSYKTKAVTPVPGAKAPGAGRVVRRGWRRAYRSDYAITKKGYAFPRHGTLRQVEQ